jgi:pimeloyl-ACP methyl ester carboxylesterase
MNPPATVAWRRAHVGGRSVPYGVAGDGLPVLFLHGWGLGHQTYRAALGRIAAQPARVYAPALPGFSGTAELPSAQFSLAGYAHWAAEFLDAVGVSERVVAVGHSFGGGVAIRLAYDYPERVRSLVLVNSIGGSAWRNGKRLSAIAQRPLWDWGLHFPGDIWPLRQATRVLPVVLSDAVPNMMRNPRAFAKVANLARRADLRPELEAIKARETPVTVLWADRDGIIPRESFDALCAAVGSVGKVVSGSHSWLLADPDAFSEVITNDLDVARQAREAELSRPKARKPRHPREVKTLS